MRDERDIPAWVQASLRTLVWKRAPTLRIETAANVDGNGSLKLAFADATRATRSFTRVLTGTLEAQQSAIVICFVIVVDVALKKHEGGDHRIVCSSAKNEKFFPHHKVEFRSEVRRKPCGAPYSGPSIASRANFYGH
jgi:hypothetical protein